MDAPRFPTAHAAAGHGHARSALEAMLKDKFLDSSKSQKPASATQSQLLNASSIKTPTASPTKARSLSDSTPSRPTDNLPQLSPSPRIKENLQRSQDDTATAVTPSNRVSRRPDFASALLLQMPERDQPGLPTIPVKAPSSPHLDRSSVYGSPAKVLPRHSRGLDFARFSTNLHHSTLAEQSSPDSSPTITQKGVFIPSRKMSMTSMALDTGGNDCMPWSSGRLEKGGIPSSLGSVSMMASDDSSNSDDDMDGAEADDAEDMMLSTPQVRKRLDPNAATPFSGANANTGISSNWANILSPVGSSFMNFQRARLRLARSRKSSSSASNNSAMASPVPTSPTVKQSDGYFGRDVPVPMRKHSSRRESISLNANDLNLSSGNDSDTEAPKPAPMTPGVVRRPVTRRGNLLVGKGYTTREIRSILISRLLQPKSRAFGRIKAELMEESMPIDSEIQKEAEVIRQVRHAEVEIERYPKTANSSPTIQAMNSLADSLEGIPESDHELSLEPLPGSSIGKGIFAAFGRPLPAANNSIEFWNSNPSKAKTPPPPTAFNRGMSTMSDDINMDSPNASTPSSTAFPAAVNTTETAQYPFERSRGSTPSFQPPGLPSQMSMNSSAAPTAADGLRKQNKRRRDDDLDMMSFKRRAVSPSCNSPIISQSPSQSRDLWGQPKSGREGSTSNPTSMTGTKNGSLSGEASGSGHPERSSSTGSIAMAGATPVLGPKKVGLMGMNDMQGLAEKMSLE